MTDKLSILMLNPFSKFAAVRQYNLAKRLAKRNCVTLALPKFDKYSGYNKIEGSNEYNKYGHLEFVHPWQLPFKNIELSMLPYVPSAYIKLMKYNYDIVHAFRPLPFSALIGYQIAKKQGVPFILEMGDIESETMNKLDCHPGYRKKVVNKLEKFLIENADMITCMNEQVKKFIVDTYDIQNSKVKIISNGVDTKLFSPDYKIDTDDSNESKSAKIYRYSKSLGKSQNKNQNYVKPSKINLCYVGKLDNIEHIKSFVERFGELGKKYRLTIIGDGDKKQELQRIATGDVSFLGRIEQSKLPVYMNNADILIAPFSQTKGVEHASNLKIFEYMSMAKPVVVSNIKGKEYPHIYTYEPDDMKDLKRVLKSIDYNIHVESREYVKRKYDWNVLTRKLEKVYKKVTTTKNIRGQK